MIELLNVVKRYGEKLAVDGLNLVVREGEICCLIGPSGCGKSTTLKMINRMVEPDSGKVIFNGEDVRKIKPELLRRRIGYVIQHIGLFPHMNVFQNISVVPKLLGWSKERIEKRVGELLELIGLDEAQYANKYPSELSGGEAQRVGVARALAADPPALLMDEPFGAVDPLMRSVLQDEFLSIQRKLKKTVVFVTHDLDEAIRIGDRIAVMKDGKLVQYDTPEAILASPANSFVRDFVGSDRALKRLSRFDVNSVMKKPFYVFCDDGIEEVRKRVKDKKLRYLWVVEKDLRLIGWIDMKNIDSAGSMEEVITNSGIKNICIREYASLREALSRMLSEGVKVVPIVNSNGSLVGEVSLSDIEAITEEVG